MTHSIIVRALWDTEAGVWTASSHDIDGLAVEGRTFEQLRDKVLAAIDDLIELNGSPSPLAEVPVHIFAETLTMISNPAPRHGILSA